MENSQLVRKKCERGKIQMNVETQLLEPHPECQSKVNWKCIIDQIECNDNLHVTYVAKNKITHAECPTTGVRFYLQQ